MDGKTALFEGKQKSKFRELISELGVKNLISSQSVLKLELRGLLHSDFGKRVHPWECGHGK
jgi:hypothetical protein